MRACVRACSVRMEKSEKPRGTDFWEWTGEKVAITEISQTVALWTAQVHDHNKSSDCAFAIEFRDRVISGISCFDRGGRGRGSSSSAGVFLGPASCNWAEAQK